MCNDLQRKMQLNHRGQDAPDLHKSFKDLVHHIVQKYPTNKTVQKSLFNTNALSESVMYLKCQDKNTLQDDNAYCIWYLLDHDIEYCQGAIFYAPATTPVTLFDSTEHFETICSRFYYAGQNKGPFFLLQTISAQICAKCNLLRIL